MKKMKWVICGCCEGSGRAENPAFDQGFTGSEWEEMCGDYDDRDDTSAADRYLAGAYDVQCGSCSGSGKVQVPNVALMTFAEKRALVIERQEERANAQARREIAAEYAAERRMGC